MMPHEPGQAMPPLAVLADTIGETATLTIAPEHGVFATFTIAGGQNPVQVLPNNPRRYKAYIWTVGTQTESVWVGSQAQVSGANKAGASLPATGMALLVESQEQYFAAPNDATTTNTATLVVADYFYDEKRVHGAIHGITTGA